VMVDDIHRMTITYATYHQNKCNTLIKERDAVSTIMESKIKVLVQSVAQSAGAVVSSNPAIGKSQAGTALTKVG